MELKDAGNRTISAKCKNLCRPPGSGGLPEGILAKTSDLHMRPLWGSFNDSFLENGFVVMVFHYDGFVDQWYDLQWASNVIHVSAMNQTKWWFAKRFLHPDIVAEYDYVFLWDEDLDIEHFDPGRYVSIIKEEELDISQPALDPGKKYIKLKGGGRCYDNSTGPPCFGWVEMMAPVFSKAAWRCAWYLIQNDLIHGWGIDFQLGYCAQGDRKQKVGVVDAEYIVHLGVPSLGGLNHSNNSDVHTADGRSEVRRQSYTEMRIFRRRWDEAVKTDKCWVDRYADHDRSKKKCVSGAC
ncbi:Protein of unknown function DUF707 [Cynara cardunculus var. scolymus]|uniref:Galactosyl transferase n=1 Tax=Cynara cardunculus var. scolymus TaxID=59895 RepID=A0A103YL41_CYNCS|nr:Protein of unknown function DUF707 [Cynara cardunculus var. scolymus]